MTGIHQIAVDITKSSVKSAQLKFIVGQLPVIQAIITEFETRMKDNKDSHLVIDNFFKEVEKNGQFSLATARKFLNHYKGFDGAIDPIKVVQLETSLNFIVDQMCSMINDATSVNGNAMAAVKGILKIFRMFKISS